MFWTPALNPKVVVIFFIVYRSHALRGNASCNAPALRNPTLERRGRHSHAERGNDVNLVRDCADRVQKAIDLGVQNMFWIPTLNPRRSVGTM